VFEQFCSGPQVVIGSSMGGWMALLAGARDRQAAEAALAGRLVLIAPAPDFTEQLMWNGFSPEIRRRSRPRASGCGRRNMGEPYPITRALIEEGRNHLLARQRHRCRCPVRILQGAQDPDVPWQHALRWRIGCRARTWC
jgi:pimeloyl-ACP methyl ester carboxylesterase